MVFLENQTTLQMSKCFILIKDHFFLSNPVNSEGGILNKIHFNLPEDILHM